MGRHWLPGDLEHLLAERAPEGLFVAGSDRACEKWIADQAIPEAEDLQLHHFCRAMASLGEELDAANHGGMYGVAFFMTCATTVLSMLVDAFGTARHMPPQSEDQSPRQTFATLFEKTLSERLPAEDWAYFGAAANKRLQALDAARQGRLDVSRSMFVELWEEHSHAAHTGSSHAC